MKHCDLGAIDGPIVLFGGPYSNLHALEALTARARGWGLGPDQMICTGDVVAYGGSANGTVSRMMQSRIPTVAGNCEIQLASGADECGCGFAAGSACDLLSAGWFAHASAQVTTAQRGWMAALPDIITFDHHGARYGVIHGGVTDVARFLWSTSPDSDLLTEWNAAEDAVGPLAHIVCGHSGIAFVRDLNRGRWINAGVIGMPPHDGTQQTQFMWLEAGQLTLHRLRYDAQAAARAMVDAGLIQGYHRALLSGYWPSEEVLPPALRAVSLSG